MDSMQLQKDAHLQFSGLNFHLLNGTGQSVKGKLRLTVVDKDYLPGKEQKKYQDFSQLECVKTGQMANCCKESSNTGETRMYHVII